MTLAERHGDLLSDDADVLVNTTNATGPRGPTMGKGVAFSFAQKWPSIVAPYKAACRSGELRGGVCRLFDLPGGGGDLFTPARPRKWAAFCTKHDWQNGSDYRWIASGLADLVNAMLEGGHRSVAMPQLGCGNGGLEWPRVRAMIEDAFHGTGLEVRVYVPRPGS